MNYMAYMGIDKNGKLTLQLFNKNYLDIQHKLIVKLKNSPIHQLETNNPEKAVKEFCEHEGIPKNIGKQFPVIAL